MTYLEFERLLTSAVKIYNADKEKAMKARTNMSFHLNLNVKWIF